ncbi:SEL1-like repeat protein [Cupriavidus numazuensis]|uniref:DUF6396 domain-containing protein n=1 Tax=Cupriavidus numazuensis TaxID=221992 RepID=A0ABM8TRM5_9BURK|nr:sel1 repeat family protein [Cupriavidus numazuensis]CAG2158862.1 hypothetical protein LMG26411_06255 [Cupriavidus numazuensis]
MRTSLALLLAAFALTACSKEKPMRTVPDLAAVRTNLAFSCVHETDHLPPLAPEADKLFKYARFLQTRPGPKDFDEVARYYRIAAAHGHYKANRNLQQLVSQGLASSPLPQKESIDLASHLVDSGVPSGYYDIGYYLNLGYGLKQDWEMALRYFRKAADLGSAEAQFYVAKLLAPMDKAPNIARQMRQCATEQGHGHAAFHLGIDRQGNGFYPEAVSAFQNGVMAGDTLSALALEEGFKGPPQTNRSYYLALPYDAERSRRYKLIGKFIDKNDGRNPKVPDIDQIVPLPPAKLPPWDGTFQWERERAAPPEKPSDELINRLSKEKGLDPATGLPLEVSVTPEQSDASTASLRPLPLGTKAETGKRCPQSGVWCVPAAVGMVAGARQRFAKGDIMPPLTGPNPRRFAWMDALLGDRQRSADVTWELTAHSAEA